MTINDVPFSKITLQAKENNDLASTKEPQSGSIGLIERLRQMACHCEEAVYEIERLRAALDEIASDPTGVSDYQAEIAKLALAGKALP